ncbi:hypothetical protein OP500_03285 [Kingella sp. SNUBH-2017]|nr:hypothetical protein [Kingella sp. SNUBH-2017]MDD2182346.1 hypothetical protein [Kingella sp. SNUBH-2017]
MEIRQSPLMFQAAMVRDAAPYSFQAAVLCDAVLYSFQAARCFQAA